MAETAQAAKEALRQFLTRGDGEKKVAPIAPLTNRETSQPLQTTSDANKQNNQQAGQH
jgi:hypothetical protein